MEKIVMARTPLTVPAPAPKAWESMSKAEKLSAATDLALGIVHQILELGIDARDVKLLAQVKDTALAIISAQVRVDEKALSRQQDRLAAEREQALARLVARLPERFRPAPNGQPASDGGQDVPTVREAAAKDSEPR
jgi:hypothetical protein